MDSSLQEWLQMSSVGNDKGKQKSTFVETRKSGMWVKISSNSKAVWFFFTRISVECHLHESNSSY